MPEDDDALDPAAQVGMAQELSIAVHDVTAEARAADDLGDQRPPPLVREGFGSRPRIGTGDDHRSGAAVERDGHLTGPVGDIERADAAAALVERAGHRRVIDRAAAGALRARGDRGVEPRRKGTAEGLAIRKVQVHRSRRPLAHAARGIHRLSRNDPQGDGRIGGAVGVALLGHGEVCRVAGG